jgi:hypothetical protein
MVVWMNTPNGAGGRPRRVPGESPRFDAVWRSLECVVGGIVAVFIGLLSYPALFDLMEPLGLLSSSMVTFTIIFTWLFVWGFVAIARDHITGDI